jgi:hypothetical protein
LEVTPPRVSLAVMVWLLAASAEAGVKDQAPLLFVVVVVPTAVPSTETVTVLPEGVEAAAVPDITGLLFSSNVALVPSMAVTLGAVMIESA